jgi:hypothetical protein
MLEIKTRADLLMLRSQSTDGFIRYGSVTGGCTLVFFVVFFQGLTDLNLCLNYQVLMDSKLAHLTLSLLTQLWSNFIQS